MQIDLPVERGGSRAVVTQNAALGDEIAPSAEHIRRRFRRVAVVLSAKADGSPQRAPIGPLLRAPTLLR